MNAWDRIEEIGLRGTTNQIALLIALSTTLLGLWALAPWVVMNPTVYGPLLALAPQWVIAVAFLACGGLHLGGILGNHWLLRRWACAGSLFVRAALLIAVVLGSQWSALGIADFTMWTVGALWVFVRLGLYPQWERH